MSDLVAEMKARARKFLCEECSVIIDEWDFPQRTWHQITARLFTPQCEAMFEVEKMVEDLRRRGSEKAE